MADNIQDTLGKGMVKAKELADKAKTFLGMGMAEKAATHLQDRKRKTDEAIDEMTGAPKPKED